jgi:ribosome biogenesis GTPase / thiamine phosphate phosphatase
MRDGVSGVVLSRAGGRYNVLVADEVVEASLRGRVRQKNPGQVLVGDRVSVTRRADGPASIEAVEPRTSVLRRRTPGKRRGVRLVAANIDRVFVVGATIEPEWNSSMVDRFLAVVEASGIAATVVVNKTDLVADVRRLTAPYHAAGYRVFEVSAKSGSGMEALTEMVMRQVSLFTGSSGVGKSSLLNAIEPELSLRTAAVSRKSGTGRHTTVAAEMFPIGRGGFVVDTPGLRDITLWGLSPQEVGAAFPEISRLAGVCRFDDCRHLQEPDCAVSEAAAGGRLNSGRLESYRRLLRDALDAARPWA